MPAIAVIDDRDDMRGTILRFIQLELRKQKLDWEVVGSAPLDQVQDYPAFVREEDVRVLVLDEKLDEVGRAGGDVVQYAGHSVAEYLRKAIPELPQFIVTSVDDFGDDSQAASNLEAIIQREDFRRNRGTYVARMIRAGVRFIERHEQDMAELSRISRAIVEGDATEDDRSRLDALRESTQNQFAFETAQDLRGWLDRAEVLCAQLEQAITEVGNSSEPGAAQ